MRLNQKISTLFLIALILLNSNTLFPFVTAYGNKVVNLLVPEILVTGSYEHFIEGCLIGLKQKPPNL